MKCQECGARIVDEYRIVQIVDGNEVPRYEVRGTLDADQRRGDPGVLEVTRLSEYSPEARP